MSHSSLIPTSDQAKRMATIMHRALTTRWSEKEVRVFRKLLPIDEGELQLLERYYKVNWPPSTGRNVLRHDLATLINNFQGECDRARIWCAKHPPKAKSKIIEVVFSPDPVQPATWTEQEQARNAEQRQKLQQLKERLRL